jgi:hypothetical protein
MNKRPGEAVLRGFLARQEAEARAVNAGPWEPAPGMVKRQCPECWYWFAAPASRATEDGLLCPDCATEGSRGNRPGKSPRPAA